MRTPRASTGPDRRSQAIAFAIFALVALAAWLALRPGISGFMLFDDLPQLRPIVSTIDVGNWRTQAPGFLLGNSGPLGRPVSMLTFAANAVADGDDIAAWKYGNVMLHLLNGCALFWLVAAVLRRAGGASLKACTWPVAACVAGLWLLHPLHVSTVLYTVQRMTQLSTLFTLSGLAVYVAGRERMLVRDDAAARAIVLSSFLVFCPIAALCKENGVLFPLLAGALEYFCYRGRAGTSARFLGLTYGILLALPALAGAAYLGMDLQHRLLAGFETREFTLAERMLTEPRVVVDYLMQLVFPLPGRMPFFYDNYAISHGLLDGMATPACIAIVASLLCAAWKLRVRAPLIGFGIAFFFAGHALESTILPLELVFEHRNYLPSCGIVLAVVVLAFELIRHRPARAIIALGVAIALGTSTAVRAAEWSSGNTFYPAALQANPTSPRLLETFAEAYTEAGQFEQAREYLGRLPGAGARLQTLDIDCRERGRADAAEMDRLVSSGAEKIGLYEIEGLIQLANLGLDGKCLFAHDRFLALIDRAMGAHVRDRTARQKLLTFKAHFQYQDGMRTAALESLERAYAAGPDNPIPLFLAAEWSVDMRELARARGYFARAQAVVAHSYADYTNFSEPLRKRMEHAS